VEYRGFVSEQQPKAGRTPNFPAFLFTGGLVGLLIGFFASVFGGADARYDASATLGFLGLIGAGLGVLLAGVIAVLLDKRS
jgi:hypothetical protein